MKAPDESEPGFQQWMENPDEKISERKKQFSVWRWHILFSLNTLTKCFFFFFSVVSLLQIIQVKFGWIFVSLHYFFLFLKNRILRTNSHSPEKVTSAPRIQTKRVTSAQCLLCQCLPCKGLSVTLEALVPILKKQIVEQTFHKLEEVMSRFCLHVSS